MDETNVCIAGAKSSGPHQSGSTRRRIFHPAFQRGFDLLTKNPQQHIAELQIRLAENVFAYGLQVTGFPKGDIAGSQSTQ